MRRYDAAPLAKVERTPQGGLRIQGRLTRTGIFQYRLPNGEVRKEYRPEEEVFRSDSLASFRGAPITIGHPGELVTPENWREVAVGHVGDDVRQDDRFVAGTLHVQDSDAVRKIENKELVELSCGYDVDLDETPGEAHGERYDAVQRNIRGNHVAMIARGAGRAGKEVSMRLDSNLNAVAHYTESTMTGKQNTRAPDKAADPVVVQANEMTVRVDGQAEIDRLQAENEMLRASNAELKSKLADTSRVDSLVSERIELVDTARGVLGTSFDPRGKSNRQIKEAVVSSRNRTVKLDGKSEDFVDAAFQMALGMESIAATPHPSLGSVRADANAAVTAEDPIAKADKANRAWSVQAWNTSNRDKLLNGAV